MREAWKSIREELLRRSVEGEEFISISDDSMSRINSALSSMPKGEDSVPGEPLTGNKRIPPQDDVKEIEFASEINISLDSPSDAMRRKKVLINGNSDFKIAPILSPTPFTLPDGDKISRWNALRDIVLGDPVCKEHLKPGKKVVFGVGNLDAKIFFCGEAPGADEEIQGEPFVGRAGQLLTKIISAMGIARGDVYIGNIMNWRPELPTSRGNRPPTEEEMAYCLPYLKAQIEIVNPQVVVALGMTAVNGLLGVDPSRRMGKVRGKWASFEGRDLMITYHPSFLLQYGSKTTKRLVWEDMMLVMERTGIPVSEKQRSFFL